MEWRDQGLVLSARPQGETAARVSILTSTYGRHLGLVPGGQSARRAALLQPGQAVEVLWRARLADQLGTYTLDPTPGAPPTGCLMEDGQALALLSAACAVADTALPEREPHPAVYNGLSALIRTLLESIKSGGTVVTGAFAYVRWEIGLLKELGYGLDLDVCAVTGEREGLTHVSPRTGRAVSRAVAGGYADRLLRLPAFLRAEDDSTPQALCDGLALTGFFLARHVYAAHNGQIPPARARLPSALSLLRG